MKNKNTAKHVHAPASKSVSHRMLMGAALASGESTVSNVLESQDLMQTMEILSAAGAKFEKIDTGVYRVHGSPMIGNQDFNNPLSCNVHESGTSCRLLTAILASGHGYFYVHGADRMHERPIGTLTNCLEQLGSKFLFQNTGYPPFVLHANGLKGGEITISLEESSQYLSGLLLAAPLASEPITIYIGGRHVVSWPYVGLTLQTMKAFGAQFDISILDKSKNTESITKNITDNNTTENTDKNTAEPKKWKAVDWHTITEIVPGEIRFRVRPLQKSTNQNHAAYKAGSYIVEGDWSGASYLLAAGALGKTPVTVHGLNKNSLQADKALLDILKQMKAHIEFGDAAEQTITVYPSHLQGVEVDMADCPDIVPTVAVLASFAHGTTKITGVEHLRIKECDRLNAMTEELKKAGINIIEEQDGLIIQGLHPHMPLSQSVVASQSTTFYGHQSMESKRLEAEEKENIEDTPRQNTEDTSDTCIIANSTDKRTDNKDTINNDNNTLNRNIDTPKTKEETNEQSTALNSKPVPKTRNPLDYNEKHLSFKSYGDHRIVMSLSLFELAGAHVEFDDSSVISKSFPQFWDIWKEICE